MDKLEFEEVYSDDNYDELVPFVNDNDYGCEHDGCDEKATIEWIWSDEDKNTYYSFRCDEHPVRAKEFVGKDL